MMLVLQLLKLEMILMTTNNYRNHLRLQLTPLNLPDTHPQALIRQEELDLSRDLIAAESSESLPTPTTLVLYPGEIAELLIQLENVTNEVMQVKVTVEGNFPTQWYQFLRTEDLLQSVGLLYLAQANLYRFFFLLLGTNPAPIYLQAQEKMALSILWRIKTDFFEFQGALPQKQGLQLDYRGQVQVFSQLLSNSISDTATRRFNIYIRPHSLYSTYLPEIYQNTDFIGRLLNIFEQTLEPDVNLLNSLWAYFDPLLTSGQFLPFLAHWVGWQLTPSLTVEQQRYLVFNAIKLYRSRGTRAGLRLYLHLATGLPLDDNLPEIDKHIRIEETFGGRFTINETSLGSNALIGGGQPNHFKVILTVTPAQIVDQELVRFIIEQEKPAFSTYELIIR